MSARKKFYDSACYDIAASFLGNEPALHTQEHIEKLAQEIQDCIENYIEFERPKVQP